MKRRIIKSDFYAFSLAEMMIVMLIISILTAAMLPVITKRQKDAGGGRCLWSESPSNSADIYSREAANSSVIVGATSRLGSGNEKLQINSTTVGFPQLGFAETGNVVAAISVDSSNNILFGNTVSKGISPSDSIAIGHNTVVYNTASVAIGSGSSAVPTEAVGTGVAIGNSTRATGPQCVSIGKSALASDDNSIAIGNGALAEYAGAIAIGRAQAESNYASAFGEGANASGTNSTALGTGAVTEAGTAVALGSSSLASGTSSIALGPNSKALGDYSLAFGSGSYANSSNSIAIGSSSNASGTGIAIGPGAVAPDSAISIGSNVTQTYGSCIVIGNGAVAADPYGSGGNEIVIGNSARASYNTAMAIGNNANAAGPRSLALGDDSHAISQSNTAIGYQARTDGGTINSTAIGTGAHATQSHQIVIGTPDETVLIAGHLEIGRINMDYNNHYEDRETYFTRGPNNQGWVLHGGGCDNLSSCWMYTVPSDRRLKNVGEENQDGLDKINQLKVFNYTFKKDKKHTPRVGVIAQDLQKVFPNSVKVGANGYLEIHWDEMFYAMINSIKELDLKIVNLSSKFNALNSRENSTSKKLDEIYKSNKQLSEKYNNLNNQLYNVKQENIALKAQLKSKKIIK